MRTREREPTRHPLASVHREGDAVHITFHDLDARRDGGTFTCATGTNIIGWDVVASSDGAPAVVLHCRSGTDGWRTLVSRGADGGLHEILLQPKSPDPGRQLATQRAVAGIGEAAARAASATAGLQSGQPG